MFKRRNRAIIVRDKNPVKTKSASNFWQSAALVLVGAVISFASSLGTGIIANRNENKKLVVEQKVVFEKDVAHDLALNLTVVRDLLEFDLFFQRPKYNLDSARQMTLHNYNVEYKKWVIRSTSTSLLMRSYVDNAVYEDFEIIDSSLFSLGHEAYMNDVSVDEPKQWLDRYTAENNKLTGITARMESFMHELHEAILK